MRWLVVVAVMGCSRAERTAPVPERTSTARPATSCVVSVFIEPVMTAWIGTTAGSCRVPLAELGNELRSLRQSFPPTCTPPIEIASDTGVYQDLVSAMDVAVHEGFIDVAMTDRPQLSIALPARDPTPHCIAPKDAKDPPPPPTAGPPAFTPSVGSDRPEPGGKLPLQDAPVLIVSKTEMLLHDQPITMAELASRLEAEAKQTLGSLGPLQQRACDDAKRGLRPAPGNICPIGLLILQADAETPASVINAIVATSRHAGYDNLLFAVKQR